MKYPNFALTAEQDEKNTNSVQSCPNCWGYSQWGGQYFPSEHETNKATSSVINSRDGFIQKFVKKYIR